MENKVRYKLHKVKKQWVTLAVASAALATIVGGSVATSSLTSAEEINNTNGSPSTTTVGENTNPVVEKEVGTTTEVGNTSNATTTERAAVTADKPAETTVQPNSGTTSDRAAAVEVEAKPETTAKPLQRLRSLKSFLKLRLRLQSHLIILKRKKMVNITIF